jgi:hypothetical protein
MPAFQNYSAEGYCFTRNFEVTLKVCLFTCEFLIQDRPAVCHLSYEVTQRLLNAI